MDQKIINGASVAEMKEMLSGMNAVDVAEELENLEGQLAVKVFRMLGKDMAADVFAYLSKDMRQCIVDIISDKEIGRIMDDLFLDDAVDFIEEMPANVVRRVLATVNKDTRELINHFLKYPEDSAGSLMTIEYVGLRANVTVLEAFKQIREAGVDKETIYTCYVMDTDRRLLGAVSARTLLLAEPGDLVGDIMDKNIISAKTTDDKEEVVNDFRKYGLLAVPVVDHENRLVGIVTVDDAFEAHEEEATEDFELMAAMSPSDEPYLRTGVWELTKNRVLWLLLLMLSATVTGSIISGFEGALAGVPALIAFIPMLMGSGGNAGAQSSTMVIRGMAIEEIELKDALIVFWKELRVAMLCGAALMAVNFGRVLLTNGDLMLALTVSAALFATIILAKSVGSMLPMAAKKLKMDPAVMASPVITTVLDASSLLVYFALAKLIMRV
jgi:magnesium transporter